MKYRESVHALCVLNVSYGGGTREGINSDNQLSKIWIKLNIDLFSWPVSEAIFQNTEDVDG